MIITLNGGCERIKSTINNILRRYVMEFFKSSIAAFISIFINAFDFKGVMARGDFWKSQMVHLMIFLPLMVAGLLNPDVMLFKALHWGYALGVFIPIISSTCRRCRDAGWNVWWILTMYIPAIGWIPAFFILTRRQNIC